MGSVLSGIGELFNPSKGLLSIRAEDKGFKPSIVVTPITVTCKALTIIKVEKELFINRLMKTVAKLKTVAAVTILLEIV